MTEEWREIPGTDYGVSNLGRVASYKHGTVKVLKQWANSNGYTCVSISGGRPKKARIHILVAAAFLPPRPTPGHEINHIDGDKANSRVDNLEWVTHSVNVLHTLHLFGRKRRPAESFKLCDRAVKDIRAKREAGVPRKVVAAEFGISPSNVTMVTKRHTWGHVE